MGKKMFSDSGDEDTDREFSPLWMMMASQSLVVVVFSSLHVKILRWNLANLKY